MEPKLAHFDVYDHNGDPADSVAATAAAQPHRGRALAAELAAALEAAQVAINSQGYNG